ncbi:MAG: Sec-independent protein translocase protein TatB [Parvibaculum sp.]|nr:Sec-independent protein translocase protein TatB [Parvibaculum sp.]
MFDIGWSELLVIAAIAIIFVGPKDLPKMMRTAGQYVAKVRGMAREFQSSFDELARETELEELRKEVAALKNQATKPLRSLQDELDKAVKAGGAGAAAAPAASTAEAKPTAQPLDTSGVSEGIAASIREAEEIEAFGAGDPAAGAAKTGQSRE